MEQTGHDRNLGASKARTLCGTTQGEVHHFEPVAEANLTSSVNDCLDDVKDFNAHMEPPHRWSFSWWWLSLQPGRLQALAPSTAEPQAASEECVHGGDVAESKEGPVKKKRKSGTACLRTNQLLFQLWAKFLHENHTWAWQRCQAQAQEWVLEIYVVCDKQGWRNRVQVGIRRKGLGKPLAHECHQTGIDVVSPSSS